MPTKYTKKNENKIRKLAFFFVSFVYFAGNKNIKGKLEMNKTAEKFIEALRKLESDKDLDTIVSLFSDDSEIGNVTVTETMSGTDGARKFWQNYHDTFGEIESTFHNKISSDNTAALEWTSKGTSKDGSEIDYDGVSILEIDGDKIKRFFAYFNPGKLGQEIEKGKAGNAG